MKNVWEFLRKYYEVINYVVISLLLLGDCFVESFAYVVVVYCFTISILNNTNQNIKLMLFTYPFQVLYLTSKMSHNLYSLIFVSITLVIGVKYLIQLIKKKRALNYKLLICFLALIIYLALPFHVVKYEDVLKYIVIFAALYLVFELRDEVDVTQVVLILCYGLILSGMYSLLKPVSDRLSSSILHAYPCWSWFGITNFRYCALFNHPNGLGITSVLALSLLFTLFYKNKIKFLKFVLVFTALLLMGYITTSRSFLLAFSVLLLLFFVLYILKLKKQSCKYLGIVLLVVMLVPFCFVSVTKNYILLFQEIPNNTTNTREDQNTEEPEKKSEQNQYCIEDDWWRAVYDGEVWYDPGRIEIYKLYLNDWSSSVKNIWFGRGISAPKIGQMHAHNTIIQLLWSDGIVGCLLILLTVLAFKNFKIYFKNLLNYILVITGAFIQAQFEVFSIFNSLTLIVIVLELLSNLSVKDETENQELIIQGGKI